MNPRTVLLTTLTLLSGCARETPAREPSRGGGGGGVLARRAEGELVADLSHRGEALLARPLPAPEDSDADRTLRVRWLTPQGARRWRFDGLPVIEARFIPQRDALLVITTDHRLLRLDGPEATPRALDERVFGPLSLDALGRAAVYTRGEVPMLEVVRVDLGDGTVRPLAPTLVPAWSPTLAADGGEVITVASPEGTPGFYRLREGTAPQRWMLPADTPLPTGPTAAVVFGDSLVYESDGALVALGFDGSRRKRLAGAGLPVLVTGAPTLLAHDARGRTLTLGPRDLAP